MDYEETKRQLFKAVEKSRNNNHLHDFIEKIRDKKIVIYGAGCGGHSTFKILSDNKIRPIYFLDIKARPGDNIEGIPIYLPNHEICDTNFKNDVIVILCVMSNKKTRDEIIKNIKVLGYKNVLLCEDIFFSFSLILESNPLLLDYVYYKKNEEKILKCVELFTDNLSIETYRNNILAYIFRKFDYLQPALKEYQYFPTDIPLSKGYSRFIDCGAFDGDTIKELIRIKGIPECIFAFEPDLNNYSKLNEYIDFNGIKDVFLIPCAVSHKTELLKFNINSSTDSGISSTGNSVIQAVSLDDILKSVSPTFIKMDIEGAEYQALIGSKNIIMKYKPDLAICVYHYFNHYFEIPLLIDSWNLGYRFYLRTYGDCANETVMYATCER